MKSINLSLTSAVIAAVVIAIALSVFSGAYNALAGIAGSSSQACRTTTFSNTVIGDDLSSTILSSNGRRSYARIEQQLDANGVATSTVFLSFSNGDAATTNSAFTLATSTGRVIEFGLNDNFNYTGAVTGITNGSASTTVKVTECTFY